MTCKYFYWSTSKNKERYQEKIENEKIAVNGGEVKPIYLSLTGSVGFAIHTFLATA